MDSLINWVSNGFSAVQQWLFEAVVQPALFALGLANFLEDAFVGTAWFMVGAIQILVLLAV
ncbi:MAG: fatty acid hydroxylase, partial [Polaromonas sp.]|nr:fatty acid hydroxylase [Polaromonas sp.]